MIFIFYSKTGTTFWGRKGEKYGEGEGVAVLD
jgi:hypothetical protein